MQQLIMKTETWFRGSFELKEKNMYIRMIQMQSRIAYRAIAALIGMLSIIIGGASAHAQCSPDIACGVSLNPGSGSKVILGQTIKINFVKAGITASSCFVTNGNTWLAIPDGAGGQVTSKVMNGFTLPAVGEIDCDGTAGIGGGDSSCLGFTTSYVVSANDINKNLQLGSATVIPQKFADAGVQNYPGSANQIHFYAAAEGDAYDNTGITGLAYGEGKPFLVVVYPGLTITKTCNTNCFTYGGPISFHGTICNTGNVVIAINSVTDTPSGGSPIAITNFATTTSLGRAFNGTLTNGDCVTYSGSYQPTGNLCGPFTDTVVVNGTTTGISTNAPVSATNSATCDVCTTPCIGVTKNCSPSILTNGGTVTFSGFVTNCGDVPLTNVTVFDSFLNKTILTVPYLTNGAVVAYSTNYTATMADCGKTFTNTVVARGTNVCPSTGLNDVSDTAHCSFSVQCTQPGIGVTKQVACFLGVPLQLSSLIQHESLGAGETCGTFSNSAVGISGTSDTAAFCYTITITNSGLDDLTNVTVIDTNAAAGIGFGDLTTNFPCIVNGVLAAGQSCSYTFKAEVTDDLTNIVTVSGQSAVSGATVSSNAEAVVTIYPAEIECHKYVSIDGGPLVNSTNLPDTNPHLVVWYVAINNPSTNVNLMNVTIDDTSTNLGCAVVLAPFELDAGMTNMVAICTNTLQCTNGFTGMINTVVASANTYTLGTNHIPVCAIDINGSNVVVTTAQQDCSATITCPKEEGCRVTGGGRQDAPLDYPHNVRYVTHGGQVGAPVGNHICTVTADFAMGNPCIHGRWQHVRHMQGGNMGNFHASLYDTLMCACLDTNLTPVTVIIPGVGTNSAQTYTNMVYGPGTVADALCNPDNNPAGPQPSPAPANKMAFTGIGDYVETQGRRVKQVLFRVDIEDRSEPGGSKPKGGKAPPDRNRTRIWILSADEIAQLHGSGADPFLLNFRNAISACNGINVQDGASVANGASAFGVRPPDIDDGGELSRGNYQLHPSIKSCP